MQFNPVYVNAAEYQEMLRYPSTAPACADGTSAIVVDLNGMQLRGQLANLKCHTHAHLKGACMGAGIEIPAFASHITAAPDVQISLPEFGYGLIPGAGGTVSVLRRIGRQACAELALTGRIVGAEEAAAIGLIDQISD